MKNILLLASTITVFFGLIFVASQDYEIAQSLLLIAIYLAVLARSFDEGGDV